jgi:hypothetical protein
MQRHVLFVHGGEEGAHEADQELAARLQDALGAGNEVRFPKMPNEDPEVGRKQCGGDPQLHARRKPRKGRLENA